MKYYMLRDYVSGELEFYVPDEATKAANTHLICVVGTEIDAQQRAEQLKTAYLESQAYRFTIAKEDVDGSNTVWRTADLTNDPEDGVYQVFNHAIGSYEAVNGLTNAVARLEQIKTDFINELNLDPIVVSDLPPPRPSSVQNIPVEVM